MARVTADPGGGAPPGVERRTARHRYATPATLGAALLAAATVLVLHDPHVPGSYGRCPSAMLGFACPGCGGLRGTSELLHGDVAAAWAYNPLAVIALPAALVLLVRWTLDARAGREPWSPSPRAAAILVVALLLFGALRNVPALAPYLGPLAVP